jgi:DNA-binding response OmpR family regulator
MGSSGATAVVVDDDPLVRHMLAQVFEAAGFAVTSAENGEAGVRAILDLQPLIASVDLNMPGIDGIEAARRVRAAGLATHIIMISASDLESDVVMGLTAGADEYLYKPVRVRELRARIDAVLRRTAPTDEEAAPLDPLRVESAPTGVAMETFPAPEADDELLTHYDLTLNAGAGTVSRGDAVLDLTPAEFALLAALMTSKTSMRSKADLSLVLRGLPENALAFADADEKAEVDRHMSALFGKLESDIWQPRYIKAVQPIGYRLTAD